VNIMWKNTIKKNLEEEEELAVKVIQYARNELKLKGTKLETVLRIALMNTEMVHGEMAEDERVDSIAGSRFER
jgi:chromosome condensin MukBEF complex kleisin-like MukF subunit